MSTLTSFNTEQLAIVLQYDPTGSVAVTLDPILPIWVQNVTLFPNHLKIHFVV